MTRRVTAVVENGVLKPLEPLELPEGKCLEFDIEVDDPLRPPAEEANRRFDEALEAVWREARKYPKEWWDDFDRELRENRVTFEERVFFEDES
jgi:predicted DNA-binding antitoxin AbrB/MazE fold protein